jgi:hypothetical protein
MDFHLSICLVIYQKRVEKKTMFEMLENKYPIFFAALDMFFLSDHPQSICEETRNGFLTRFAL